MMETAPRTFHLLPDRERRHLLQFYLAPRWAYGRRLMVAGALIVTGLLIQLIWKDGSLPLVMCVSGPIVLAGVLFLLHRGYDSAPAELDGEGAWEKTTLDRFEAVARLQKETRRWDETIVDMTCVTGVLCFLGVVIVMGLVTMGLAARAETRAWGFIFAMDALLMILPLWITGTRRGWRPDTLGQQVAALNVALQIIARYRQPACQIQPMFEMKGGREARVPVAARAFIRFPDGPADFYGLQLQVALNEVQGTFYPYLYAVLVAKRSFGLLSSFLEGIAGRRPREIVVEPGSEADVEVIVIRQRTTKTKGYHTKAKHIGALTDFAWQAAGEVLQGIPT